MPPPRPPKVFFANPESLVWATGLWCLFEGGNV